LGFKGNPNIGCVVFNDIIDSPEYKFFENIFSEGDKIFVISSIFGGTGSSGFPQLIENLKNSNNNHIKNAAIGALVVKPYFKVRDDENSTINSDLFNSKTKAALRYYSDHLNNISSMYYIGDKSTLPYDNIMGGADQQNIAHVVEFLGAKSIIHFVQNKQTQNNFYEFGMEGNSDDQEIIKGSFFNGDEIFWQPFSKLILATKIHKYLFNNYDDMQQFFEKLGVKKIDRHYFNDLEGYTNDLLTWLKEMKDNQKSLNLFNLSIDSTLNNFVVGKKFKLPTLDENKILKTLIENVSPANSSHYISQYLKSINNLIDTYYQNLLN